MAQVYVGHPCPYCGNTGYKPTRRFKPLFWLLVILTCGVFWVIDALFQWFSALVGPLNPFAPSATTTLCAAPRSKQAH